MAVNQKFLEVSLKDDFKEVFKSESDSTFHENIETSLARAAELANKGLSEFVKILSRYDIPWMEYTEETFKEDQEALEDIRGIAND